tara:strand:+ start:4038 stop:4652 length:615 start_codon:yes stop_codon:yes gene_type:complete
MGCWNETCGLTTLPIFEGQECVMVVFKLGQQRDMDSTDAPIYHLKSIWGIQKGLYNDYGWIKGFSKPADINDDTKIRLPDYPKAFFHVSAWEKAIAYINQDSMALEEINDLVDHDRKLNEDINKETEEVVREVLSKYYFIPEIKGDQSLFVEYLKAKAMCFYLRRNLSNGMRFAGCQHDVLGAYKEMFSVSEDIMREQEAILYS